MEKMRLAFAAALTLGGCTSFEPLRPDMEARPTPSRIDEIAYINGLRVAFDASSMLSIGCYTGKELKSFRPKYVQGYPDYDNQQDAFNLATCVSYKTNPATSAISTYLENGFGLTDLYCQRYFVIATETRQSRRLQKGLFKTGDTVVNAVLGALSGTAKSLAISSAGFSGIDSAYGAIDEAFVVAPTRDDVRKLVLSAQQNFRAEAFEKPPKSYPSARAVIERYAGLCSFDGMRQLVGDSVAGKTDELNREAERTAKTQAKSAAGKPTGTNSDEGLKTSPVAPVPISP